VINMKFNGSVCCLLAIFGAVFLSGGAARAAGGDTKTPFVRVLNEQSISLDTAVVTVITEVQPADAAQCSQPYSPGGGFVPTIDAFINVGGRLVGRRVTGGHEITLYQGLHQITFGGAGWTDPITLLSAGETCKPVLVFGYTLK
jgi:hypothetical protein